VAHEQEVERLLYVATTRARRTLVLVLDQELFATAQGHLQKGAQLRRLLRGADVYGGEFDERSSTIEQIPESRPVESAPKIAPPIMAPLSSREVGRAVQRASAFITRFTPSAFDFEAVEPAPTPSRLDNPATLYGNWWHRFFQRVDWKAGEEAAQHLFAAHLPTSPDLKTAAKDWSAIFSKLFRDPLLSEYLGKNETQFHREFPFAWRINERTVVEGFIDLLMIDESANRCLVLDWKTNRLAAGGEDQLRKRYRSQIAAYWKAVGEITKLEVEAGIYATATGQFLPYDAEELEAEWERLRQLPPDELSVVVSSL